MAGQGVKRARPLILGGILALSYCRTLSLFHGYSAPMQAYRHLPSMNASLSSTTAGLNSSVFTLVAIAFNVTNFSSYIFRIFVNGLLHAISALYSLLYYLQELRGILLECRNDSLCWQWMVPISFFVFLALFTLSCGVAGWWLCWFTSTSFRSYPWRDHCCTSIFQRQE